MLRPGSPWATAEAARIIVARSGRIDRQCGERRNHDNEPKPEPEPIRLVHGVPSKASIDGSGCDLEGVKHASPLQNLMCGVVETNPRTLK